MRKNFFFKWLYKLEKDGKAISEYLTDTIRIDVIENSITKFNRWRKNGEPQEKSFDRHRNRIKKSFYNNQDIETEIHELNQKMVDFLIINEHKKAELLKHKTLFDAAKHYNFPKEYFYHLEQRQKFNQKNNLRSLEYWYERFDINYHRFFHPKFTKHKPTAKVNHKSYEAYNVLQESWTDLQKVILIHKIRMACDNELQY